MYISTFEHVFIHLFAIYMFLSAQMPWTYFIGLLVLFFFLGITIYLFLVSESLQ